MLGNSNRGGAALAAPAALPTSSAGRGFQGQREASDQNSHDLTPWIVAAFLGVWLLVAVVIQHQRLKSQIQPKNIGVNLFNFFAIGLQVVLFYALARIGLVKLRLVLVWLGQKVGGVLSLCVGYATDLVSALIKVVG